MSNIHEYLLDVKNTLETNLDLGEFFSHLLAINEYHRGCDGRGLTTGIYIDNYVNEHLMKHSC